jgi:hypothetical protein
MRARGGSPWLADLKDYACPLVGTSIGGRIRVMLAAPVARGSGGTGRCNMDIVSRAKNILISPRTEWAVIATERTTPVSLYVGYVCILAAIPAIAMFLEVLIYTGSFVGAIALASFQYVPELVALFICGFIAAKLAPHVGGQDDINQGLKLVAYSLTPHWLSGVLHIVPPIFPLADMLWFVLIIASLYGICLCYLGVPVLMKTPADKTIVYMIGVVAVTVAATAIVAAVLYAIVIVVSLFFFPPQM